MRIKCVRDWRGYRVGETVDRPDGMANVLIKRGFFEEVEAELVNNQLPAAPENAMKPASTTRRRQRRNRDYKG